MKLLPGGSGGDRRIMQNPIDRTTRTSSSELVPDFFSAIEISGNRVNLGQAKKKENSDQHNAQRPKLTLHTCSNNMNVLPLGLHPLFSKCAKIVIALGTPPTSTPEGEASSPFSSAASNFA